MASIFNSLSIGYSGLNAAQVGINTTGHNIANAEVDGYSRQRVVASAATPLSMSPGNVGNGVEIQTIKRVFDNFVFDRYTGVYEQKEYNDLEKSTLEQLSTFFPEIDEVGIKADLQEYYNMWQTFSDNPDNDAIKIALAKQTEVLSEHIQYTANQVSSLQEQLNDQVLVSVNEVNALAKELTEINKSINVAEFEGSYTANDLRDKRNVIERDLARLVGAEVHIGQIESNINIDSNSNTVTGSYTIHINGVNIVDGTSYHPIYITNDKTQNGFYEVSYEQENGTLIPMEENLNGGKIGSLLNLRGSAIETTSGIPNDGLLQDTINELNYFAETLIQTTNNLYAQNATTRMDSNALTIDPDDTILSSGINIREGSFNIIVYDIDGNIAASREISIDYSTSMSGASGTNSIQGQIETQVDDNADGNANNDIDDFMNYNWATPSTGGNKLEFTLNSLSESKGYTFAIEDKLTTEEFSSGTNFAGATGMHRFFDGNDSTDIELNSEMKNNPTILSAGYTDVAGDNRLASNMIQHQFERFEHGAGDQKYNTTSYGMFDIIATNVGTKTNSAIMRSETTNVQFNAVELEYFSTSKVSIDEEMTNLIKYQTSYGAAAKIITTIDQMMQTLLGIKQ